MDAIQNVTAAWETQGRKALRDELLSRHTTFHVGGAAPLMLLPQTVDELLIALELCRNANIPYFLLGNGSNILAADEGWSGVIIKTKDGLQEVSLDSNDGEGVVADCGLMLSRVAIFAAEHNLDGMAWAHGIPGTVGGAVKMNGGAYDGCMSDIVCGVDAVTADGKQIYLTGEECQFSYRHSIFMDKNWTVLRAHFKLKRGQKATIQARMEELQGKRKKSQPLEFPSAGSYFKRPPGYYAAALIDECGLKGYRTGDAQVSEKHAGFVINYGNATAADMIALEMHIKATVKAQTGVELICEVVKLGL
ncbi:MAG: UDP-N-acetylmuramate dehydrogenase [Oscillospiraceae bacterium]|nr:UDP-N-acetylmuramate dehydrogenase [Oscillospiraceae bacterium]